MLSKWELYLPAPLLWLSEYIEKQTSAPILFYHQMQFSECNSIHAKQRPRLIFPELDLLNIDYDNHGFSVKEKGILGE